MIAVDTNVLVRLLTEDDPEQARRARALFETGQVYVAKTVLLETSWVLGETYGFDHERVIGALLSLLGLPQVTVESETEVARAIEASRRGLEFADALHVASSAASGRFVTFDGRLARRAVKAGFGSVERL